MPDRSTPPTDLKAADALYHFQTITNLEMAPDGRHVVYTVRRVDRATEKKHSDLWVAATNGSGARRFTYGDHTDTAPRWSPDGAHIAFLSNRSDARQMQLYILPFNGGEARPLTDLKGEFGRFEWSPDGRTIAFNFRKKDAAALEREADEQKKKLGVVARHITRVHYRADAYGYLPEEKWHLWRVEVESGETTQLTDGDRNEGDPTWSPDGKTLLFASNRNADPDFNMDDVQLYTIPAAGGEIAQLPIENHENQKGGAVYSPDGAWIAYIGRERARSWWQNASLYVVPAAGGAARNLTGSADLHLFGPTASDLHGGVPGGRLTWSPDGGRIYFQVTQHGAQKLMSADMDGNIDTLINSGGVGPFSFDASHSRLAYWYSDWTMPSQLFVCEMSDGATRRLTDLNPWLDDVKLGPVEEIWFNSDDGHELHGWIVFPPDFDPAQTYPTIVQIHGGPQTQDGDTFSHEFRYLAEQGYVVAICNPRGSQGYGEAHAAAIHGRFGQEVDYADVMALADYLAAQPYVDVDRMGVTGGSYGGIMTATVIGRTDRFKAAVVQRMVSNWISMHGTSDFNWGWTILAGVPHPWEDPMLNWRQSPISLVPNVTTPALIIHSEADYRTNREQGEQYYVALKTLGVDTELVLFPDESHGLSRMGRTDRRVARLEHMARWFEKYLK